jgi:hypothetical protein
LFQAIHELGQHGEGFRTMCGGSDDVNGGLADRDDANSVGDSHEAARMSAGNVLDDPAHEAFSHGLISFVLESGDCPSSLAGSHESSEGGYGACLVIEALRAGSLEVDGLGADDDVDPHGLTA